MTQWLFAVIFLVPCNNIFLKACRNMKENQSWRQLNGYLDYWYDAQCPTNRISYLTQLSTMSNSTHEIKAVLVIHLAKQLHMPDKKELLHISYRPSISCSPNFRPNWCGHHTRPDSRAHRRPRQPCPTCLGSRACWRLCYSHFSSNARVRAWWGQS